MEIVITRKKVMGVISAVCMAGMLLAGGYIVKTGKLNAYAELGFLDKDCNSDYAYKLIPNNPNDKYITNENNRLWKIASKTPSGSPLNFVLKSTSNNAWTVQGKGENSYFQSPSNPNLFLANFDIDHKSFTNDDGYGFRELVKISILSDTKAVQVKWYNDQMDSTGGAKDPNEFPNDPNKTELFDLTYFPDEYKQYFQIRATSAKIYGITFYYDCK